MVGYSHFELDDICKPTVKCGVDLQNILRSVAKQQILTDKQKIILIKQTIWS